MNRLLLGTVLSAVIVFVPLPATADTDIDIGISLPPIFF